MTASDLIALLGLVAAILIGWNQIQPKVNTLYKYFEKKLLNSTFSPVRRNIVIGVAALPLLGYLYSLFGFKINLEDDDHVLLLNDTKLIVNKHNGCVHHPELCQEHLPLQKNRLSKVKAFNYTDIHRSKSLQIAGVVAADLDEKQREKLLLAAISNSPTSTHLYKHLVKLWGRQKKYGKIHKFLAVNIEYIEALKDGSIDNPRLQKKYRKALVELEIRQTRAKYHKGIQEVSV